MQERHRWENCIRYYTMSRSGESAEALLGGGAGERHTHTHILLIV